MADLLAKWLNEDIKLSQKINDFEKDFSNGYLFGELLNRFKQQDNFNQFSQKDNVSSKVQNFEKLEPTLRNLNIKFDSLIVDKIMKQERGYALRLLYQLKMILEKTLPPTDVSIVRKTGKLGNNEPALKLGSQKDQYNKMQSQFFKTRLQALNKPQKQMSMELHLKKFEDEQVRQFQEHLSHSKNVKEQDAQQKQELRRAQINKLQRNAGFMEEWLQKGVEDWKTNMAYKKEREQGQLEFEYKVAQNFNETTQKIIEEATHEVNDGIDQFEATLINMGINPNVSSDQAEKALAISLSNGVGNQSSPGKSFQRTAKMTQSLLQKPTMGLGGTMTKTGGVTLGSIGLRSQAKKPLDSKGRKERDRRRMRMISDQMTLLHEIEKDRREQEVLDRMKTLSKQEEELEYEKWRTSQCKAVIVENRKLREAKYDKRHELDTETAIFKERQALDSMQDQMIREIDILQSRNEFLLQKQKQAKNLRRKHECSQMIDQILEIFHEAYDHMQKADSSEIDPRCWHEWEQLFIEAKSISEAASTADTENVVGEENVNQGIDYLELVDYLQNKGQWPTTLVSDQKPNLEQILSGQTDAAPVAAVGKGKAPPKGPAATETVAFEEGDLILDDKPANNFLVGDAIEQIINLNFDARKPQLRPKNPHYLNLKLCFIGKPFVGKKVQADRLKEKYGLASFTMNELVDEALKFYQENPEPIIIIQAPDLDLKDSINDDSHHGSKIIAESGKITINQSQEEMSKVLGQDDKPPAPESDKAILRENPRFKKSRISSKDQVDDAKSENSELEEELNPQEDFRRCGQQIQDLLYEGKEISDQLYVELYIAKLRITFSYKDKETLKGEILSEARRELELTQKLTDLKQELEQMQQPDAKKKKKRTPENVNHEIAEAEIALENIKMVENNGWILIDFPANSLQAVLLEKALSGYQIPEDLQPTLRETEQQLANLLVKPSEKVKPPKTLIPSGIDAVIWFDCSSEESLRRALGRRVDPETNSVYHIQDNPPSIEKSPLCELILPIDDESESTACLVDRSVAFDQTAKALERWLTEFGDESNKLNLLKRIDANGDIDQTTEKIEQVIKTLKDNKAQRQIFLRQTIQQQLIADQEQEEKMRKLEEDKQVTNPDQETKSNKGQTPQQSNVVETSNKINSKMASRDSLRDQSGMTNSKDNMVVAERSNIENEFKVVLMNLWKKTSTNYKDQMVRVLKRNRFQRDSIQSQIHKIQLQFLQFLKRTDNKQQVLDKFVKEFNEFSEQFPDLREDEQTKEELHQRADNLSDELWEIIEERKEQAIDERKKIMDSGMIEYQLDQVTSCAQQMMQCEIDKFKGIIQLIHDYYHAIDEKLIPEAPEAVSVDIVKDEAELPEIEKVPEGPEANDPNNYQYPRLEDFYKRALKAQAVPDVIQQAQQNENKGGKGAPGKDKKDAKGKPGPAETEEVKQESAYMKEMREAIKVEKSILRYRLTQIRNWGLSRLKDNRSLSLKLYKKLEDWITVSVKAENDAIDQVCEVIKENIEQQTKIRDELRINFMDFTVDKTIANFIEPPPKKLETISLSHFDQMKLDQFVIEINELSDKATKTIRVREVVDLLIKKLQNTKSFSDIGALPRSWTKYSRVDIEQMIGSLDKDNNGRLSVQAVIEMVSNKSK